MRFLISVTSLVICSFEYTNSGTSSVAAFRISVISSVVNVNPKLISGNRSLILERSFAAECSNYPHPLNAEVHCSFLIRRSNEAYTVVIEDNLFAQNASEILNLNRCEFHLEISFFNKKRQLLE